jgi:hypothetical protein
LIQRDVGRGPFDSGNSGLAGFEPQAQFLLQSLSRFSLAAHCQSKFDARVRKLGFVIVHFQKVGCVTQFPTGRL